MSPETTAESVGQHLQQNVEGQRVDASDDILAELSDPSRLRKIYKLNTTSKKGAVNGTTSAANELKDLETFILGAMALKGS